MEYTQALALTGGTEDRHALIACAIHRRRTASRALTTGWRSGRVVLIGTNRTVRVPTARSDEAALVQAVPA